MPNPTKRGKKTQSEHKHLNLLPGSLRWLMFALGGVLLWVGLKFYYEPPIRTSEEITVGADSIKSTKTTRAPADSTTVAIALLTGALGFVVFAVNGVRFWRLKAGAFEGEGESNPGEIFNETVGNVPTLEAGGAAITADIRSRTDQSVHPRAALPPREEFGHLMETFMHGLKRSYSLDSILSESWPYPDPKTLGRNSKSLYFFGHDLMLTWTGLITEADEKQVAFALKSAIENHVAQIGLKESPCHRALQNILKRLENPSALAADERRRFADTVWVISRFVGDVLLSRPESAPEASPSAQPPRS